VPDADRWIPARLTAIDELCDVVSHTVVHQLAAALGGRRLLRDRLAMLGPAADAALLEQCESIYAEWCYERRRLGLRWLCPVPKWKDDAKLNAVMRTAEVTGAEGIAPPPEHEKVTRPPLLTAPVPPKTAALRPSPLLLIQGWNSGNEDTLVSWLDGQSSSPVYSPQSRKTSPRKRLPPVGAKKRG